MYKSAILKVKNGVSNDKSVISANSNMTTLSY